MPPAATSWASCLDDLYCVVCFEVSHVVKLLSIRNVKPELLILCNLLVRVQKNRLKAGYAMLIFWIELGGVVSSA
ncbi:TPA: hypothetical protein MHS45_26430 [Klebsiella pneumoniae]|nr:hypothetical protein [Klebsiella pneumoniae]HBX2454110.1 hypothetical protein [Klebsiella pneumoniae]